MKRVGHMGADLITPGNTVASFEAALAAGVDMIEFDVLPERWDRRARRAGGELLLAHNYDDLARRRPTALTLEQGLDHFAGAAYRDVELMVDLKLPGYERRVVDALRARALEDRALVSTMEPASLYVLRSCAPALRLGLSIPRVRRNPLDSSLTRVPALAALAVARQLFPRQMRRFVAGGRCEAVMAHVTLVTPRLVDAVVGAGGELYAWTVDDEPQIRALEALGVSGVITNDPRLFGAPQPRMTQRERL